MNPKGTLHALCTARTKIYGNNLNSMSCTVQNCYINEKKVEKGFETVQQRGV